MVLLIRKLARSLTTRRCLSTAFKSRQWTIGMSKRYLATTIKNDRLLSSSAFVNDGHHHHFVSTKVLDNGAAIQVDDSVFHASWLWTSDPTYIHPTSGQRLRTPGQYPQSKIRSCQVVSACLDQLDSKDAVVPNNPPPPPGCFHSLGGVYRTTHDEDHERHNYLLQVTWDTNEISYYDLDWLARCRYDTASLQRQHTQTKVTKEIALGAKHNKSCPQIPTFGYDAVMTCDDIILQAFHGLNNQGAVLIENAAVDDDSEDIVASLGKQFGGSLSHGALYGDIFHVQSAPNANNIAYTTVALPPHQDLTYYESKPFLQLLHCVNKTHVVGGESVLMDALAAAEEFKLLAPDLYEVLTQTEATFLKQREGGDMVSRKPHIVCSGEDVVSVHWSPPFEGPLAIAPELVDDYFVAYSALERMLDNSVPPNLPTKLAPELERMLRDYAHEFTWEQDLQPGQILVFNNQRMLHGRRAFRMADDAPSNGRHMIGCYTNVDETISRYRLLLREASDRDQHVVRNAGNGIRGSL